MPPRRRAYAYKPNKVLKPVPVNTPAATRTVSQGRRKSSTSKAPTTVKSTSAQDKVVDTPQEFDVAAFPRIIEALIANSPPELLLRLRAVNKAMKAAVDDVMPLHAVAETYTSPIEPAEKSKFAPLAVSDGLAIVPHSHPDPEGWIAKRAAAKIVQRQEEICQFKQDREKAAKEAMEMKKRFDTLLPLAKFGHDYALARSKGTANSLVSFFSQYLPDDFEDTENSEDMDVDIDATPSVPSASNSSSTSGDSTPELHTPPDSPIKTESTTAIVKTENATAAIEKLTHEANMLCWKWRHNSGPPTAIDVAPEVLQTPGARRPYVLDVIGLPETTSVSSLQPRYLRYGPLVDVRYTFSGKTNVLVLPLGAEPLHAFWTPFSRPMIVALRIDPGPIRPAIIACSTGNPIFDTVTLIISASNLKRGSYSAIMRSLLRDITEQLSTRGGVLQIVDAESIPLEWFGHETEYKTTAELMAALVKSVLKERNTLYARNGSRMASKGTCSAKFFTKAKYMEQNNLSEAEYAIYRGD